MPVSRHRRRRGRAATRGPGSSRSRSADNLSLTRPRRQKTNKFYLAAAVIIAVLVIGSFGLTSIPFGGGGGSAVRTGSANQFVLGVGEQQTIMPSRVHVADGVTVEYNTVPASSGEHYDTPVRCGFYREEIPDERIVHNLEHGNIVVSYNLDEEADQLEDVISGIGLANAWAVSRPYLDIPPGTVALAAWGVLDFMQGVDGDRIKRFFDNYSGTLGPEFEDGLTCIAAGRMP